MPLLSQTSIRHTFPALLAILALLVTGASALLTWYAENASWEESLTDRAASLGHLVLPRIERAMARDFDNPTNLELTNLAVARDVENAFLTDHTDRIRYSTRRDWEGRSVSEVCGPGTTSLLDRARRTLVAQFERSADSRVIRAVFPFALAPLPGELRPSRQGTLVLEMALVGSRRELGWRIASRSLALGGLACFLCAGVWYYLHTHFARRVERLVAGADAAGRGELAASFSVSGNDELAQVGKALERMAAELRRQFDNLRESEARYRNALENSAIGVALVAPDGTCLEVNSALCEILGYTRDELLQLTDQALSHPDERALGERAMRELLSGAKANHHREKRYLHKSGRVVWASLHAVLVRKASGDPLYFVAQVQDITARRQAESEQARFAQAIDVHFDGAFWLNVENRIVYVNQTACRLLGYAREDLLGQPLSLIAPRATPERMDEIWRSLRTTGRFQGEGVQRSRDGTEFPIELVATLVRVDGEEFNCNFTRDLRPRLAAEREREEQFAELQRWRQVMLGREDRVRELKAEINALCNQAGLPPRYPSQLPAASPPAAAS